MNFTSEPQRWIGEKSGHRRLFLFPMWPATLTTSPQHAFHCYCLVNQAPEGCAVRTAKVHSLLYSLGVKAKQHTNFLSIHFLIVFKIGQMWKAAIPNGQSLKGLMFMTLVESCLEHNLSFDPGSTEWDLGRSTPPSLMVYLGSTDI